MAAALTIYGDPISGNCLKVKWVAARLKLPTVWKTVEVMAAHTRSAEFLALSPAGQVPIVVLPDGEVLRESNAIIFYLAEGSPLIPATPVGRARMLQWMFWEQYSHEPYIAVRRFQLAYQKRSPDDLDPKLWQRGNAALALMQSALGRSRFIAGEDLTLADVALVAYTRMADQGGFDLSRYPAVADWVSRVEAGLSIADPRAP